MHEVLVNRLGGLSLPRKSVVRLTDRPDMTLDVYRERKNNNTTTTTSPDEWQHRRMVQNNSRSKARMSSVTHPLQHFSRTDLMPRKNMSGRLA